MDTKRSDDTKKTDEELPQKTISKTGKKNTIWRETNDFITGMGEADYTTMMPYLVGISQSERRSFQNEF